MPDLREIRRPRDLPQWKRPPLDEVAISIQFKDIPGFKAIHYGLLAERLSRLGKSRRISLL